MELLDLPTLATQAGLPLEAVRRYRDDYVRFVPAVRLGRTIGFPAEAVEVVRFISSREAAGDDPKAVRAALEATYPVSVLSTEPIEPGTLAAPDIAILALLRGVDARYAALADQVTALAGTMAMPGPGDRPAAELEEFRATLGASQAILLDTVVEQLAELTIRRATDQTALTRMIGGLETAGAARHEQSTTALQALAAAVTTSADHEAVLGALERQHREMAAIRTEHARLLDAQVAKLTTHVDDQIATLVRHMESRAARADRRIDAIASLTGGDHAAQASLAEWMAAIQQQAGDHAAAHSAALEQLAYQRDETARQMRQLVAEALATIQQAVHAGAAAAVAARSASHVAPPTVAEARIAAHLDIEPARTDELVAVDGLSGHRDDEWRGAPHAEATDDDAQPSTPNRRRLGYFTKPGDLGQAE